MKIKQTKAKQQWEFHLIAETDAEDRQLSDLFEMQPNTTSLSFRVPATACFNGKKTRINFRKRSRTTVNLSCWVKPRMPGFFKNFQEHGPRKAKKKS